MQITPLDAQRNIHGKAFPLLVEAAAPLTSKSELNDWLLKHRDTLHGKLIEHGAVLLRGLPVDSAQAFEELLDQTQFLDYFPMLKDREKRIDQDDIWRQICNELNWEFIPTI